MAIGTFKEIRSQVLHLEKQTEGLLTKYSNFQNQNPIDVDENEDILINLINEAISKRDSLVYNLIQVSESESVSSSKYLQLSRHKEILNDHKRSFKKITDSIQQDRNRNNLLQNVRSSLNERGTMNGNDYIIEERQRVDNANSLADRLLNSAFQTRDDLINQRQYLQNAQQKMLSSIQSIPGINVLISKINTRRKRDSLILASVITACILLLFFL